MPKGTLHKVSKQIAKKRSGKSAAMHEKSRDSHRLQRAGLRDEKLARLAASRNKMNLPHLVRIAHFRTVAQSLDPETIADPPYSLSEIQSAILAFIHRDDEEQAELKKARRPGRPPTAREELLRQRVEAEDKEYDAGFYCPDLQDTLTVAKLREWDGEWISCNAMKFIRVARTGERRDSVWPPKGLS